MNLCNSNELACGTYGNCVPKLRQDASEAKECDGIVDCDSAEDEDPIFCRKTPPKDLDLEIIGESLDIQL